MSFASLLRHEVVVMRQMEVVDGNGDTIYTEFGHPTVVRVDLGDWRCRIEPRSGTGREGQLVSQAGAGLSTHTVYGFPRDLQPGDRLIDLATDQPYEVDGIPDDAGGAGHHYEVAVSTVTAPDLEPATGS